MTRDLPLAAALLALLVLGLAASPAANAKKEAAKMEWKGAFCRVEEPSHRVVKTAAQWQRLWRDIGRPAPALDLTRYDAVAVFLGRRNTGGYGVVFAEAVVKSSSTVVGYRVKEPSGFVTQVLTAPFAVRLYDKSDKPVSVEAFGK